MDELTVITCIVCPKGCRITAHHAQDGTVQFSGYSCPRGLEYAEKELSDPTRVITSTVRIVGAAHRRLPVKTDRDIPKRLIFEAMKLLDEVEICAPVKAGDIVIKDILNTNANFVATRDL